IHDMIQFLLHFMVLGSITIHHTHSKAPLGNPIVEVSLSIGKKLASNFMAKIVNNVLNESTTRRTHHGFIQSSHQHTATINENRFIFPNLVGIANIFGIIDRIHEFIQTLDIVITMITTTIAIVAIIIAAVIIAISEFWKS